MKAGLASKRDVSHLYARIPQSCSCYVDRNYATRARRCPLRMRIVNQVEGEEGAGEGLL